TRRHPLRRPARRHDDRDAARGGARKRGEPRLFADSHGCEERSTRWHLSKGDYRTGRERWRRSLNGPDTAPRPQPGFYAGGYDPTALYGPDNLEDIGSGAAKHVGW